MSSPLTAGEMAEQVAGLMEQRLKIGGKGLAEKLRRGKRRLPRKVRKAVAHLAEAEGLARHPKIGMMLDQSQLAAAHDTAIRYLKPLGGGERLKAGLLGVGGQIALGLLVVAGGTLAVLVWRGFL